MKLKIVGGLAVLTLFAATLPALAETAAPAAAAPAEPAAPVEADAAKVAAFQAKFPGSWVPTNCTRPVRPTLTIRDAKSYEKARPAIQAYFDGMNEYQKCMASDAQAELTAYQNYVQDGMNKVVGSLNNEVNGVNGELQDAVNRINKQGH